jgi:hypothetical protein
VFMQQSQLELKTKGEIAGPYITMWRRRRIMPMARHEYNYSQEFFASDFTTLGAAIRSVLNRVVASGFAPLNAT